jgi:hypothetical protein
VSRPSAATITLATVALWTAGGLWADSLVGARGQLVLGLLTAVVLAALLAIQEPAVRFLALGVVAVATVGEVVGSLVWGLYGYRLENLPAFVPPGHGLVYLAGVSVATLCATRQTALLASAAVLAAAWGAAGLLVLPVTDVAGAIGCAFLLVVFARTRQPAYAGVFLVVAALELYGTALGTWTWEATVPGLGLPQGNPPSGVASGYVVFDVAALGLLGRVRSLRDARSPRHRRLLEPGGESRRQSSCLPWRFASTFTRVRIHGWKQQRNRWLPTVSPSTFARAPGGSSTRPAHSGENVSPSLSGGTTPPPNSATSVNVCGRPPRFLTFSVAPFLTTR